MDGVYNKHEIVHNIIALLEALDVSGQKNVVLLSNVFQMLTALQKGLRDEDDAKNKTIEMLKEQLKRATEPATPENGGDVIGGERYELQFGGVAE